MPYHVVLYSPDRGAVYDGYTPNERTASGSIMARISLLEAFARSGYLVDAYINCPARLSVQGVNYFPLDEAQSINCDVFIGTSSDGTAFVSLPRIQAALRIAWITESNKPSGLEKLNPTFYYAASNGLRDELIETWNIPAAKIFVCDQHLIQQQVGAAGTRAWDVVAHTWNSHWDYALEKRPASQFTWVNDAGKRLLSLADGLHDLNTGVYKPGTQPPAVPVPAPPTKQPAPRPTRAEKTGRRVMICGYYGFGNTGDEAILADILATVRSVPGVTPVVVSGNPSLTHMLHNVEAVLWTDMLGLLNAARDSDLILLGGGGLYQDYWGVSTESLLTNHHTGVASFSNFVLLAALLNKPLIVYAIGVGPLNTDQGRLHTRMAFEQAETATVRDSESLELVLSLGVSADQVEQTADPAFRLRPAPLDQIGERLEAEGLDTTVAARIGVAVRPWNVGVDQAQWTTEIAAALDQWVDQTGGEVVFVPFQTYQTTEGELTDDRAASEMIRGKMQRSQRARTLRFHYTPAEVLTVLSTCNIVLGMRLHAVIMAAVTGVPAVGLVYDPKVINALRQLGLEDYALPIENTERSALYNLLLKAHQSRDLLKNKMDAGVRNAVQRAERNHELLLAQLAQPAFSPRNTPIALEMIKQVMAMQVERTEEQRALTAQQLGADVAAANDVERWMRLVEDKDRELIATLHLITQQQAQARQRSTASKAFQQPLQGVSAVESGWAQLWRAVTHPRQAAKAMAKAAYHTAVPLPIRLQVRNLRQQHPIWREYMRYPYYYIPRTIYHIAVPYRMRVLFRTYRGKLRMNWYVFAFDRFKRERMATYGDTIEGIRTPAQPGLVTVVLPAYNGEDMVGDAIETIQAQSYPNWELICINDGSTDRTGEILDSYAKLDSRIRVVHQENRKIPRTLSRGFQMARGEFFTWTSCDNRLKPDFFEKMVGSLQRNPCWDGIYANVDIIGEDGNYLRNSPWYEGYQRPPGSEHVYLPETTGELNTWPNNSVGAAFMYRARVSYLIGDYSRFRFTTEDYDYWMRINALFHLRHADFPDPVYDYRFHDRSLTSKDKELGITRSRDRLMVFDEFRRDFYLAPLVWVIDVADSGAAQAGASLRQQVERAGHIVYKPDQYRFDQLPPVWTPVIYAIVTSQPSANCAPPADLPPSALRAMVAAVSPGVNLPDQVNDGWDTCIAVGSSVMLPRLSGKYQGWLGVDDTHNLFHALDTRTKEHHAALIEELIETPPPAQKRASVIICTYRMNERLANAIRSVAHQTMPADDYEVVVVNNNPANQGIVALIDQLREQHFDDNPDRLRLVVCPILGLSAARNAGIAAARGEYLCFIDDDAIAQSDWLQLVCEAFDQHPDTGVVGGHIILKIPQPRPRALQSGWEKYWSQFMTGFKDYAEVNHWWEFPWGANWSARRRAILYAGGFRTRYGRRGVDFGGGEEVAAASLIQRLEYKIAIQPRAVVQHDVEPSRYSIKHVRRTLLAGHISQYLLQRDLYIPMTPVLRSTVAQIAKVHVDPYIPRRSLGGVLDMLFRKPIQFRLLAFQLRDLRARFRTAVVNAKICNR
jgi:polysaccharide pyruvyl transferase CsaB